MPENHSAYEQGYKDILAAERKAYMPSSIAGDKAESITFVEYKTCDDMIAVENPHTGRIEFGVSPSEHGVDVFVYTQGSDNACAAMTITTGSWDTVCAHLVETNLHPEWFHAQQLAFANENITAHKPRGLILKQVYNSKGRLACIRVRLAKMLKRPIYTALELTDGTTAWEQWA